MKFHLFFSFRSIVFVCISIWGTVCFGQTDPLQKPEVIPLSPEASGIGRYGDILVGYYSGIPAINIPIYTVKAGSLELPISLDYHATGIKVEQEATWVGLGWNLISGGVISLTTVGGDDNKPSYSDQGDWDQWSRLFNSAPLGSVFQRKEKEKVLWDYISQDANSENAAAVMGDIVNGKKGEQDIYHVDFPNYSFKFILHPHTKEPLFLGKKFKCIIKRISASSWEITDDIGNKYLFSATEGTLFNDGTERITSWFLTKITSPNGNVIELEYSNYGYTTLIPPIFDYYGYNHPSYFKLGNWQLGETVGVFNKYLTKIKTNTNNEVINFQLSTRLDLAGDGARKLDSISIYRNEGNELKFFKKFEFDYNYFDAPTSSNDYTFGSVTDLNFKKKRLRLDSISEVALNNSKKPPYKFSYDNTHSLPYKTSSSKDYWGFYNGKSNSSTLTNRGYTTIPDLKMFALLDSTLLLNIPEDILSVKGADRRPDSIYIKTAMLNEIVYPTGGKTIFSFEPHRFNNHKYLNTNDNISDYIKTKSFSTKDSNNPDDIKKDTFTIANSKVVSIYSIISGKRSGSNQSTYTYSQMSTSFISLTKIGGGFTKINKFNSTSEEQAKYNTNGYIQWDESFTLDPGTYIMESYLPDNFGIQHSGDAYVNFNLGYTTYKLITNYLESKGGGIRIKSITNYDQDNKIAEEINYKYTKEDGTTSGILMAPLNFIKHRMLKKGCGDNNSKVYLEDFDYWQILSGSNIMLAASSNGNNIGYSRIEVSKKGTINNGKEVYYYTNFPSVSVYENIPPRDNIGNGNIIRHEVINSNDTLVKSEEYFYKELEKTEQNLNVQVDDLYVGPTNICGLDGIYNPYSYLGRFLITFYPNVSIWNVMYKKIEKTYYGNKMVIDTLNLKYNSSNYQISERSTRTSNNDQNVISYLYPTDFTSSAPYNDMVNTRNIICPVILTSEYKNGTFLQSYKTNYGYFQSNTIIAPSYVEIKKGTNDAETRLIFIDYDNNANILSVSKANDKKETYIWGYNKALPVAKIENATLAEVQIALGGSIPDLAAGGLSVSQNNLLRSGLPNAQITTYTYSPLIGMTSQTDPNGITTYYEYDTFGRLKNVRDKDQNILNRSYYHYYSETSSDQALLDISTTSVSFAATVYSSSFAITANCPWTVASSSTWLTVSPLSGSLNGNVTVNATVNTGAARSAIVTVTYGSGLTKTITFSQAAGNVSTLSVDQNSLQFLLVANLKYVNVSSNTSWTVTKSETWITLTVTSGSGNSTVGISATKLISTSATRSGYVTLTTSDGRVSIQIDIIQSGSSI